MVGADESIAYLDHAATTSLRPEALAATTACMERLTGNPSGGHRLAREARRTVDEARDVVADVVGCRPSEVVFTSGGTEADNLALHGRGDVACSAVEHHAVLEPARAAGARLLPVGGDGVLDLARLPASLPFASVMLVNNEVGTVQPVAAVDAEVLHTDAVQAAPWLDLADAAGSADLVSLSAHKLGGPQGVGALVVRGGTHLAPLLLGGGQELGRRSGTHAVALVAGFAAALAACASSREETNRRVGSLRDRLADGLLAAVPGAVETGDRGRKVPGICSLAVEGVDAEALLVLLDRAGVCASAGASCASGALEPSHVLAAMGVPAELARGALRLSLGWSSQDAEVDRALEVVPAAVARLRAVSR